MSLNSEAPAAGEYVAVEKVEAVYKKNSIIEQIWVYGNSLESVLVAVCPSSSQPEKAGPVWGGSWDAGPQTSH